MHTASCKCCCCNKYVCKQTNHKITRFPCLYCMCNFNKSRAVPRKPCEAVYISICKDSGELMQKIIVIEGISAYGMSVHNALVRSIDSGNVSMLVLLISVQHSTPSTTTFCCQFSVLGSPFTIQL